MTIAMDIFFICPPEFPVPRLSIGSEPGFKHGISAWKRCLQAGLHAFSARTTQEVRVSISFGEQEGIAEKWDIGLELPELY